MKKGILLIVALLSLITAQAQYFNIRDPMHSFSSVLTSVMPYHNKYYCAGIAWDSINNLGNGSAKNIRGLKFAAYDNSGNKLKDTIYQSTGLPYIFPDFGGLRVIDSNHFLVNAITNDSSGTDLASIFFLDTIGRVLNQIHYNKPTACNYNWFQFEDIKPDGYGHWLMICNLICSAQTKDNDFLLMKLDSSFNIIWTKQLGTALNDVPHRLLIEPDGYVIAGERSNIGMVLKNFYSQALLVKTDTVGNQLWEYVGHNGMLTGPAMDVIKTLDGGYAYCGTGSGYEYLSANGSFSQIMWRGWIEKIDSSRNALWNRTTGLMNLNSNANDQNVLKELPNGDLLIAGNIVDPVWLAGSDTAGISNGSLIKMDAGGNLLWQREYRTPQTDSFFSYSFYDMKPTPDGGFVMVGQAYDYRNTYGDPTQRGWIIKVDSNGCSGPDDPQCWPLAVANTVKNSKEVVVYPNPVNDVLQISSPLHTSPTLQITDIAGKTLLQQKIEQGHSEISLQSFPPGIFLYRITDAGGYLQQGKIVKQ